MSSLTDMIVKPGAVSEDGTVFSWGVVRGSRAFNIMRNGRGDWEVRDIGGWSSVLDVSGDLADSLAYIESLFA
jgi:hypothetical protein